MPIDDLTIRQAEEADFLAIARVWFDSWHVSEGILYPSAAEGRDLSWFAGRVSSNAGRMFVADLNRKIVGFVGWEGDGIDQLFVLPAYFGKQVAQSLLTSAEDALKAQGYRKIWLHCACGNDRARVFYEKHKWHVVHEFAVEMKTNANPVQARAWHMEKSL